MNAPNAYEQLLPHWQKFCEERHYVEHEKDPNADWLYTVGARDRMRDAYFAWLAAIKLFCGPDTSVEWPLGPDSFFTAEEYIEGPCIVMGIMLFSQEIHSSST